MMKSFNTYYFDDTLMAYIMLGTALPSTWPGQATATKIYFGLAYNVPPEWQLFANEPSGNGYARQSLLVYPSGSSQFYEDAGGLYRNSVAVQFPQATGVWGVSPALEMVALLAFDAASNGNLLSVGMLDKPIYIDSTTPPIFFPPGSIVLGVDPAAHQGPGFVSTYFANVFVGPTYNGTGFTRPSQMWLALCTKMPKPNDIGSTISEPSAGGYTRAGDYSALFQKIRSGVYGITSSAPATPFPAPSASWGNTPGIALVSASNSGVLYAGGPARFPMTFDGNSGAPVLAENSFRVSLGKVN